jgi:ABC-2 type transport system permease protein
VHAPTGSRRFAQVALAVAWRNLHSYFTSPSLILPGLFFPLLFFTAFAGGLPAVSRVPGFDFPAGYTEFQYVFVLLQSASFGGVFTAFSIARDFESRFSRRLFLAAPQRTSVLAGYGLAAVVRWAFTAAVTTGLAFAFGLDVGGSAVDLLGLVILALLLNVAITMFAAGVAMRTRTIQAGPAMQVPVFVMLFLAPVYVPLDLLDGWIHAVARFNPATYILTAGRGLIAGQPEYVGLAFGLVFAMLAVLSVWGIRSLRSAERAGG